VGERGSRAKCWGNKIRYNQKEIHPLTSWTPTLGGAKGSREGFRVGGGLRNLMEKKKSILMRQKGITPVSWRKSPKYIDGKRPAKKREL